MAQDTETGEALRRLLLALAALRDADEALMKINPTPATVAVVQPVAAGIHLMDERLRIWVDLAHMEEELRDSQV